MTYQAQGPMVVYIHDVEMTEEPFLLVHPTKDCTKTVEEQAEVIASVLNRRDAIQAENTRLRAALAVSKSPCVYCSLPAEEWARCQSGFPGCARADDATGCPEFGAMMECDELQKALESEREKAEALQRTFDLQWKADMRAIKRWQDAHPGNDHVWPDRANMVVWLMEQLEQAELLLGGPM